MLYWLAKKGGDRMQVFRGFRFGMLLQLAVGPVCLMVLDTAVRQGSFAAFQLVAAAALVDGFYIALGGAGAARFLRSDRAARLCRWCGGAVLFVFGLNTALGALGYALLPSVRLFSAPAASDLFLKGVLLTASNPLTIVFWSGVFSAEIAENRLFGHQLAAFGAGCVLSTLLFLGAVALLGGAGGRFLSGTAIKLLNFAVGCIVVWFGLRLFWRKEQ